MLEETYQPGSMPEIFQLLELASRKLKQIQRDTVRSVDLTPPQYFVLSLLWERDGRTFKELADAVACSPATMTGIVDTLEGKDLVAREPNPLDRRSLLVRLTPAGRDLQEATPGLGGIFARCCDGLAGDEARELSRLLKKLNDSLG
jgi:DNA-binding MarR family transcriptional regulator